MYMEPEMRDYILHFVVCALAGTIIGFALSSKYYAPTMLVSDCLVALTK